MGFVDHDDDVVARGRTLVDAEPDGQIDDGQDVIAQGDEPPEARVRRSRLGLQVRALNDLHDLGHVDAERMTLRTLVGPVVSIDVELKDFQLVGAGFQQDSGIHGVCSRVDVMEIELYKLYASRRGL